VTILFNERVEAVGQAGYKDLPSRAVIACDAHGYGCILWWVGYDFEIEVNEAGLGQLDDLGLDDAPHGITIWEGKYVWSPGSYEHPQDGDSHPVGTFRPPTSSEWYLIQQGKAPWSETDWLTDEACKELGGEL
jgi:hypothetical protein